nr:hypothetical protein [Tanacetum cinerariifolium]
KNGDNSNDLGTGGRRQMTTLRECTYTDFLKCQPMSFQGTEGVIGCCLGNAIGGLEKDDHRMFPEEATKVERYIGCSLGNAIGGLEKDDHRMFPEEATKVERYIGGLLNMIHDNVKASKPRSMQEAIKFATGILDKKMLTHVERQEIRSLMEEPNLYVSSEIITTMGSVPRIAPTVERLAIGPMIGHYKNECPKLKNGNQGNQTRNGNDVVRAYAVGTAGTNPNSNVVT